MKKSKISRNQIQTIKDIIDNEFKYTPCQRVAKSLLQLGYNSKQFIEFRNTYEGRYIEEANTQTILNDMRDYEIDVFLDQTKDTQNIKISNKPLFKLFWTVEIKENQKWKLMSENILNRRSEARKRSNSLKILGRETRIVRSYFPEEQ